MFFKFNESIKQLVSYIFVFIYLSGAVLIRLNLANSLNFSGSRRTRSLLLSLLLSLYISFSAVSVYRLQINSWIISNIAESIQRNNIKFIAFYLFFVVVFVVRMCVHSLGRKKIICRIFSKLRAVAAKSCCGQLLKQTTHMHWAMRMKAI